ncbi:hypothetical protein B296_00056953 [Ensete ventricosum]|uniref:SKP1 component POZ domain-containing protein n=1 Tax=Ensete ventricosum TaxID=4639 RepID=A0A426XT89_ENSVE|nr:hypothetical protein B296_00056953 [Ensete ventricosum]
MESQTTKHMIEDDCAKNEIPPPTATPRSSLEYCRKHVDSAPDKSSDDASKVSDEELKTWEAEFVKVDQATLFDVILVDDKLRKGLHGMAVRKKSNGQAVSSSICLEQKLTPLPKLVV